jgi:hypothetical protein
MQAQANHDRDNGAEDDERETAYNPHPEVVPMAPDLLLRRRKWDTELE